MSDAEQVLPATPILDSGVMPPPRPKKRVLGVLVGTGIGVLFAVLMDQVSHIGGPNNFALVFYFTDIALVVTVHELAHLLAGWLVGFHFDRISIGPLSLRIEYGRLKVQFNPVLSGALGYAGMNIQTVRRIRRRLLIFVAAGPAANLISGTFVAVFVRHPPLSLRYSWVIPCAAGFALFSLLIGLVSLVPFGSTIRSDGARIWMLLSSTVKARRWIAAAALANQQRNGVRVKHWKQTWLKAVCAVRDSSIDEISGNMLAYAAASAKKETRSSVAYLERCLELTPVATPTMRDFAAREASFFCAWFRNDLTVAERWFSQIKSPKTTARLLEIRSAITLDCARGNFDMAIAGWQKGADFIERMPVIRMKATLQESWQEWGDEIKEKQSRQLEVKAASNPVLLG